VLLDMPMVLAVARQALSHGPLTTNAPKHTDTNHLLPDFYLQNTCKFAVHAAAWSTALATGATQQDTRSLTHLVPPVLESAAGDVRGAEPGRQSVKIPIEESPVVEARSQGICNLCYTAQTPRFGPQTPSHVVFWATCRLGG
jgi:hypothetical protein